MWSYRLDENWDPLDLMTRRNEVPQSESRSVAFHQFPKNRKYTFFFLLNYLQCLWNHACLLCNHVLQLDWTTGPPWFRMKHICMILFDSKEDIVVSQHVSTIKGWKSICVFHSFFFRWKFGQSFSHVDTAFQPWQKYIIRKYFMKMLKIAGFIHKYWYLSNTHIGKLRYQLK